MLRRATYAKNSPLVTPDPAGTTMAPVQIHRKPTIDSKTRFKIQRARARASYSLHKRTAAGNHGTVHSSKCRETKQSVMCDTPIQSVDAKHLRIYIRGFPEFVLGIAAEGVCFSLTSLPFRRQHVAIQIQVEASLS